MRTIQIQISDKFRNVCPHFRGVAVRANVVNSPFEPKLWAYIENFTTQYRTQFTTESIKQMPAIEATRTAYKAFGKDPSRYRPSSEALIRRILKGQELYQINTLVDLINVASIDCGHSIGGFDVEKIAGDTLTLGVGEANEPYEGIGKGPLNIEGLPMYRDALGGIGSPTSDHERTKITLDTREILMIVNGYFPDDVLRGAELLATLAEQYASATDVRIIPF